MENRYITELIGIFEIRRTPRSFSTEKRNFAVLSFRESGTTLFCLDGKKYKVGAGDALYIPPNTAYTQEDLNDEEITAIHLNTDKPLFDCVKLFPLKDGALFDEAMRFYKKGRFFDCISSVYRILSFMYSENSLNTTALSKAEHYLMANAFSPSTTISLLAEISGVSETHFRNLFKSKFGVSPYKYLRTIRLERAKILLKSGYYSVTETSHLCGYDNEKNFTTAFKSALGITPTEYKNKK